VGRAARHTTDPEESSRGRTLGGLLYGIQTRALSEQDWIRLVRSVAAGDQLALHSIFKHTHRLVFTPAIRITNSRETAEEVTMDVFHDVWRRASAYDPSNGSVVGWIMNQARSRAIDRLRFEQRKKRVCPENDSVATAGSPADPQSVLQVEEQSRLLRRALEELTPDERQAIEIAFFSEATYEEVARRLGQPLGTIKSRIRSGLSKLRTSLSPDSEGK
jgi:RNA polymerase sigma-70 factor, ECF subfamily